MLFAVLALAAAAPAHAAVSYPASAGTAPCDFAGTTVIDTTALTIGGVAGDARLVADGNYAVLNCTTLTVEAGATLRIVGTRAPDIRATGEVAINGAIDVSAQSATGGPGSALVTNPNGGNGVGSEGGAGGAGTSGGGAGGANASTTQPGGGGGGGGYAGGGGGAAGVYPVNGGQGGGLAPSSGGAGPSGGGQRGGGLSGGAGDGANGSTSSGGGGGGGAYGNPGPFHPGSAGGGGGSDGAGASAAGNGGGAGGAVRVISASLVTIGAAGRITANGANGGNAPASGAAGGGGGSGGGVQVIAPTVSFTAGALVTAKRGTGGLGMGSGGHGGDGSPGRIDITANATPGLATDPSAAVTPYSFTLTASIAGAGTITSSPAGIDCGADCSEDFDPGTQVTLSAVAAAGSAFTGWSGACSNASGDCTVSLDQARSATATFAPVATGGSGTLDATGGADTTSQTGSTPVGSTPPPTAASGTGAATLALGGAQGQAFARARKLVLTVTSSLAGSVRLSATLTIGHKHVKLAAQKRALAAGRSTTVTFALSKKLAAQVARAQRSHTAALVTVTAAPIAPLTGRAVTRSIRAR